MDRGQLIVDSSSAAVAETFRKALQPFGLDKFLLSDVPVGTLTLDNGRVLAEFRTMMLPVWYPEKVMQLRMAGLDVVTTTRQYKSRPPQEMYYVRSVVEIKGGNYGNQ